MTLRVLLGCYCNLLHRKNRLENQSSPLPSVPSVLEPSGIKRCNGKTTFEEEFCQMRIVYCRVRQDLLGAELPYPLVISPDNEQQLHVEWVKNNMTFRCQIPKLHCFYFEYSQHVRTHSHCGTRRVQLPMGEFDHLCHGQWPKHGIVYIYMDCGHHGNPNMGI